VLQIQRVEMTVDWYDDRMHALDVLVLILPTFALIAIGFGFAQLRLLAEPVGDALASFVFSVALPLLLMRSVARAEFPDVSPWPIWGAYFTGVAVVWAIAYLVLGRWWSKDERIGIVGGLTAAFSNIVLLGIPVIYTTFGEAGMAPLLLVVSIHMPVMATVASLLFERADARSSGRKTHPVEMTRRIVLSLARNPLILGLAAGTLLRFAGIRIEGIAAATINPLADAAVPCSLFAMGFGMKRYGIRDNLAAGLLTATLKLVVMPAIVFLTTSRITGLPPGWVPVLTIIAACPTGINVFLFAGRFGVGHGVAANGITLSTLAAVGSITVWLSIIGLG